MFQRFTDRARKVMLLANQLAANEGCQHVTEGHILLGIADEGRGIGAQALRNMGVDLAKMIVLFQTSPSTTRPDTYQRLLFTEEATKAITEAIYAAGDLGHRYVGTEHLLLGIAEVSSVIILPTNSTPPKFELITSDLVRKFVLELLSPAATEHA